MATDDSHAHEKMLAAGQAHLQQAAAIGISGSADVGPLAQETRLESQIRVACEVANSTQAVLGALQEILQRVEGAGSPTDESPTPKPVPAGLMERLQEAQVASVGNLGDIHKAIDRLNALL